MGNNFRILNVQVVNDLICNISDLLDPSSGKLNEVAYECVVNKVRIRGKVSGYFRCKRET